MGRKWRAPFPMTRTRPQGPRKQGARKRARGGDKLLDGTPTMERHLPRDPPPSLHRITVTLHLSLVRPLLSLGHPSPSPISFSPRGQRSLSLYLYLRLPRSVAMETPRPAPRDAEISSSLPSHLPLPTSFFVSPPFPAECRARSKSAITDTTDLSLSPSFLSLLFFSFANIIKPRAGPCNSRGF